MIDTGHSRLSLSRQCSLIGLNQSSYYYEPAEEKESSRCNLPKSKKLSQWSSATSALSFQRLITFAHDLS
jgi:hypothetical protein